MRLRDLYALDVALLEKIVRNPAACRGVIVEKVFVCNSCLISPSLVNFVEVNFTFYILYVHAIVFGTLGTLRWFGCWVNHHILYM